MKLYNRILILMLTLLLPGLSWAQEQKTEQGADIRIIEGFVEDGRNGAPLEGAHLYHRSGNGGAVTDRQGVFSIVLPELPGELTVTHLGYQTRRIRIESPEDVPLVITLNPIYLPLDGELRVTSNRQPAYHTGVYADVRTRAVEDHLRTMPGFDLVSRANVAREPVIRGLRDSRVDVRIDGMRMTPACVDGMDPLTAYLESDNLESIDVSRGQASGGSGRSSGGSVNFKMARAELGSGLNARVESGYQSASAQQVHQAMIAVGEERWAVRLSGTYRNAGNMHAGGGEQISGSSFKKGNLHTGVEFKASDIHHLSLQYIGDVAGKMGYPALIMDTRRADAHLMGIEHKWKEPMPGMASITTTLYGSRVAHRMDDYDRDVSSRSVMPDMYMPMYGRTLTTGISSEGVWVRGSHLLDLRGEAYQLEAFGDMNMEPLDPDAAAMYLVNMGDVTQRHALVSAGYTRFADGDWRLSAEGRLELGANRLNEKSARATYRAEYPDLDEFEPTRLAYLFALGAEKQISEVFAAGIRISQGTRLPDHSERYGYYIYQPLDGYFYIGNPGLDPERSRQSELYTTYGSGGSSINGRTAVWLNRMENYVAGERIDDRFKQFDNMGVATLWGTETELSALIHRNWRLSGSLSWILGHHQKLDEPLPMIPPLKGAISMNRYVDRVDLEMRMRWAASQDRVADRNHLEDRTPGYTILDLFGRVNLSSSFRLQLGVENIFNSWYVDHLSVNSFPEPGRNLQVSIAWQLP